MTALARRGVPESLLAVTGVGVAFGGVRALDDVSFDLHAGEILGLIGPNGAGKTTMFNSLCGLAPVGRGEIVFDGRSIRGEPLHRIAARGIARTFQHGALFPDMSVRENILAGCHMRGSGSILGDAMRLPSRGRTDATLRRRTDEVLARLALDADADRQVRALPFGTRKRIELARALAAAPRLLLLDEPACGLNAEEVDALGRLILDLRAADGMSVLLVEHHMGMVLQVADRVVALNFGRKIAEGGPRDVLNHPDVLSAYLGDDDVASA